ncbi:hypothetical protein PGT21_009500 [Puccinia graminis f. sp. tritici]|uniref:Uncharacterized protein n=1 Tax=Puccinia graminis f. sp. tritici TaxID=56615 RepID=A0A5B0P3X9_PUCGR|nr:hypothetical protein PGT21_009500 [Puccinia graminis f. sp. tritici]KAA1099110.1 hypothetical protein PGTUg99_020283 [Puccinia graminis f. sp. tritici]
MVTSYLYEQPSAVHSIAATPSWTRATPKSTTRNEAVAGYSGGKNFGRSRTMDMLVDGSRSIGSRVNGVAWGGRRSRHDYPGDEEADRRPLLIESSLHPAKRSS